MDKKIKNLPLGIQTFKRIIEEDYLYVDKTKDIYNLLNHKGVFFFLSRPRRFGKSLLVTTLKEVFLGNKELFKGLWIYDKIEFKKYPVIHIDFLGMNYSKGSALFESTFFDKIKGIAEDYNLILESNEYKSAFKELIKRLSEIEKVVILIDEYDKPITEHVDNIPLASENRNILKGFYEVMKESEQYIKFAFLTGVSKFSRVSVFSGLNNLRDITLSGEFSTINGYTQDELKKYFNSHIEEMAKKLQVKQEYLEYQIKRWYNGYSWDGKNFVYNPFSILYLFIEQKISNYWFQSGTPTFLLKLIKEQNIDINKIAPTITDNNSFQSYEIENLNFKSLLFQTGYLTIKNIDQIGIDFEQYTLDYPNLEVKESLLKNILGELANNPNSTGVIVNNLMVSLENKDLEKFFTILKSLFADIPSSLFIKDKEAYYHTIIYLVLTLIGVRINVEVHTNHGRIDTSASLSTSAVVETQKYIYIFEFKIGSSSKAIKQIEERKYYEKYLSGEKEILLVGVNFSIRMKNIKDFILKNINE